MPAKKKWYNGIKIQYFSTIHIHTFFAFTKRLNHPTIQQLSKSSVGCKCAVCETFRDKTLQRSCNFNNSEMWCELLTAWESQELPYI